MATHRAAQDSSDLPQRPVPAERAGLPQAAAEGTPRWTSQLHHWGSSPPEDLQVGAFIVMAVWTSDTLSN